MKKYFTLLFFGCFIGFMQAQPKAESAIVKKLNALDVAKKLPEALALTKIQFEKLNNLATSDSAKIDSLNAETGQYLFFWVQLGYASPSEAMLYTDSIISILPPKAEFYTNFLAFNVDFLPSGEMKDKLFRVIADRSLSDDMVQNAVIMQNLASTCYYTQLYDSIRPRYNRAEEFLAQAPESLEKQQTISINNEENIICR